MPVKVKIKDMKVLELRSHLEKRGLDQTGKKCELIRKLKNNTNSSFILVENDNDTSLGSDTINSDNVVHSSNKAKKWIHYYDQNIGYLMKAINNMKHSMFKLIKQNNKLTKIINQTKNLEKTSMSTNLKQMSESAVPTYCNLISKTDTVDKNKVDKINAKGKMSTDNTQSMDIKTSNPNKSVPRLLLLADSHGRQCADILYSKMNSKFETLSVFKPNALLEDVVSDIHKLTTNFSKSDFVFIIAGTNDVLKGKTLNKNALSKCFKLSQKTNVIFVSVPYVKNRNILNKLIYDYNCSIKQEIKNSVLKMYFLNINNYIRSDHYTDQGIHLNKRGKFIMCSVIKKFLEFLISIKQSKQLSDFEADARYVIHENLININTDYQNHSVNKNCDKLYPVLPATDDVLQELLIQDSSISLDKEITISNHSSHKKSSKHLPDTILPTDDLYLSISDNSSISNESF